MFFPSYSKLSQPVKSLKLEVKESKIMSFKMKLVTHGGGSNKIKREQWDR